MHHQKKLSLRDIKGNLKIYINWSANALMPVNPGAADHYLKENRTTILKMAQKLLKQVNYIPSTIYRSIILKDHVDRVLPNEKLQYLSFSTDRAVAEHFAYVNGFGSEIIDVAARLGTYGYIIQYTPTLSEILFHYRFLSILPYADAFDLLGMNGETELQSLKRQKEIMILQPKIPFKSISPVSYPKSG